jgi:predicted TIM-barrel fold metal-dependent hydrolase
MAATRLISADSHVQITHEQVKAHLDPTWHEEYDDAVAAFGRRMASSAAMKMNRALMELKPHPSAGRPGYADPVERLADMDTDGVEAEVLYCEVSAFRYLYLVEHGWREATRAFNDAMWAFGSEDPKRLVVNAQVPIHDIDEAVKEVRRCAALGFKSLQLPVFPAELGLPDYHDERYAPLFSVVQEHDLPICFHIGLNTQLEDLMQRDPTPMCGVFVPTVALSTAEALGMLVLTGVFERFPHLKAVFVEPGLGWVAWWLYIVDDMNTRQQYEFPGLKELPSYYFRRNVALTYIEEPDAIQLLRHRIGVENILWSSDYPHPVSSWPRSRALVDAQFVGVPDDERDLIVAGNAARIWNL